MAWHMQNFYLNKGALVIKIHKTATISPKCDIEDSIRGSLIEIGANSTIDSFVKLKPAGGKGEKIGKGFISTHAGPLFRKWYLYR